ncbi:MAG: CAAX prenyl protease-related protein [Vicinamibacterales bacterium]
MISAPPEAEHSKEKSGRHPAVPYVVPMAVLLLFMVGGSSLGLGPWEYPLRVGILIVVLAVFSWRQIDLRAPHWAGSVLLGVAVFALWIAPEALWPSYRQLWPFDNPITGSAESSVPDIWRAMPIVLVFRTLRAVVLVPIIEELFWRAWLMRWLISSRFWEVPLGRYTPYAFWVCAALFASVHGSYWEVGLVAGVAYNWWMVRTRSLGDCILAHAVTNALLSGYVISQQQWQYW